MEGFFAMIGLFILVMGAVGVFFMVWRFKMATDNPERYRQFREWEDEEIKRQKKIFVDAAKLGANVLSKAITKR
jgi:hypothetical protein